MVTKAETVARKYLFAGMSVVMALVVAMVSLVSTPVQADSTLPAGITVTPAVIDVSIDKPGSNITRQVTVRNDYAVDVRLVAEFRGIDEAGGRLIPMGAVNQNLSPSISISQTELILPPHGSASLTIQVSDRRELEPGGHYATLLLTPVTTSSGQSLPVGRSQSSLRSSLSVPIYIMKRAGAEFKVNLESMNISRWLYEMPDAADYAFTNTGNVHIVPRGVVLVTSEDGKQLFAKGLLNEQSRPLLPGKKFENYVQFSQVSQTWKPQRVMVTTTYRYDGQENPQQVSEVFWYVPTIVFVAGPTLLATFVYTGIYVFKRRSFILRSGKSLYAKLRQIKKNR